MELHPLGGELIQRRSLDILISITAQKRIAVVVTEQEENVRLRGEGGTRNGEER